MAIFARPADIRSGPTLMGWVLPGPIRNRVGYGFLKKNPKRVRVRFGFYLKNSDPTRDPTRIKTRIKPGTQNYKNTLIYIYTYNLTLTNPSFLQSSAASLPQPICSPSPSFLHSPISSVQQSDQRSPQSDQRSLQSSIFNASLSLTQTQSRLTQSCPLSVTLSLSLF